MKQNSSHKKLWAKILRAFGTAGGSLTIAVGLIGGGFGVGIYYEEVQKNFEIEENRQIYYKSLIAQKYEYENKISDLKEKYNNELQDLRNENQLLKIKCSLIEK